MKRLGSRFSAVLVVLVLFGFVPGAAAQAPTSQVLLGNVQVGWSAPWVKDAEASGSGQGWEQLWLDGEVGSVLIETDVPAVPAQQLRDDLVGALGAEVPVERVNLTTVGATSVSLDLARYPDGPVGMLIVTQEAAASTQMAVLIAHLGGFSDAVDSAQAGITIAGGPIFAGLSGGGLEYDLEQAAGIPAEHPVAPTPTPIAVGTTAPVAAGGQPAPAPLPGGMPSSDLPADSFTMQSNDWVVGWGEGWRKRFEHAQNIVLWHQDSRVHFEVMEVVQADRDASAQALAARELEWLNADASATDWVIESATDLDSGQRFVVVLSRTTPEGILFSVSDVTLKGAFYTKVRMRAWEGDFATGLANVRSTITLNGGQPFAGLDLSSIGTGTAVADGHDEHHTLFSSSRHIGWGREWLPVAVYPERVILTSADHTVRYRAIDVSFEGAAELTAARWAEDEAEGLRSDGRSYVTVHQALDLDNGQRMVIVLSYVADGHTYYSVSQGVKAGDNVVMQVFEAEESRRVSGLAEVQAGITVSDGVPLADIATLVPEIYGSAAVTSGAPAATESYTVRIDGTVVTWDTEAWTLNQNGSSDASVELTTRGPLGMAIGYRPLELPFGTGVVDATSYGVYMANLPERNAGTVSYQYMGAADLVAPDGTPIWVVVAVVTDSVQGDYYHLEECVMKPGASACTIALIPRDNLMDGVLLIRDTVRVNGEMPFRQVEQATPLLFD